MDQQAFEDVLVSAQVCPSHAARVVTIDMAFCVAEPTPKAYWTKRVAVDSVESAVRRLG